MNQPVGDIPIGTVSQDRQFRWDGQEWVPIAEREPTGWTRPMQLIGGVYFLVAALVSSILTFASHGAVMSHLESTYRSSGMSPAAAHNAAAVGSTAAIVIAAALVVLYLVAAVGSLRRWGWAFWLVLVLLGITLINSVTNLNNVAHPNSAPIPLSGVLLSEGVSVVGAILFIWFLVGLIKYGRWAMSKPSAQHSSVAG